LLEVEQLERRDLLSAVPLISPAGKLFDAAHSSLAAMVAPSTQSISAIPAPLTQVSLPFSDDFNTATNQQLSSNWLNQIGNFQVSGGLAAGQTSLNVATLNGINAADVSVQADVNVTGAAGQSAGLVARYSGPKNQNLYLGRLVKTGSGFKVELIRNVNGSSTTLFSQNVTSTGSGTLRFELAGSSLKLFLNNTLVAFANDSRLTTGTVGLDTSSGGTVDNFSAAAMPLTQTTLPFSDAFSTATNQQLSTSWLNQVGNFQVSGGLAVGQTSLNVATLNSVNAADVAVQADVNVTGAAGQSAGLVARYSGPKNLYLGRLVKTGSGYKVELIRNVNGSLTTLFSQSVTSTGSGTLRFELTGSSLKLFLNNTLVAFANDSQLTTGTAGINTSVSGTVDNFSADFAPLTQATLPFNDDFSTATNQQLSSNWLNQVGNFQVSGGLAAGRASLNVATLNGINAADVSVQADVNVTGAAGQSAGLVARYAGPKNLYLGRLVKTGSGFKVELIRNVNGNSTTLFSQSVTSTGSGTLRFELAGSSLKLFLNNILVAFANDSRLTTGTVGIDTSGGSTVDNFSAAVMPLTQVSLPFSDDFTTATNQQLSSNWLNQIGNFQVSGGLAAGQTSLNVATLNGLNAADVAVQADVNVTGAMGQSAGLETRYSTGGQNLYFGGLYNSSSGFKVQLWRSVNGNWTKLATQTVGSGSGNLRLALSGNSLMLFFNNVQVISVTDSHITAAGLVGMASSIGATLDNFQVS
jgi:hypothetical protein